MKRRIVHQHFIVSVTVWQMVERPKQLLGKVSSLGILHNSLCVIAYVTSATLETLCPDVALRVNDDVSAHRS